MPEAERPSPTAEHAPALDPFELSPDPMILFGPEGARLRANAAFAKTFPHALSGARPPWGRTAPPPFADGERCFEAAAPDGRRYEWRERLLPGGARIAVARDVSARAEAVDQAARAKTTLFATLTHELRTPLNGVLGMAGVLSQTLRSPAEAEYLRAIQRSGEHLLTLITEILDYARLESETFEIEESTFDPEDMAQGVAELLSPPAHAKGVELFVRAHANVPRKVLGDERRVRQILFNLVGNAVKFTDEGAVGIDLSLVGQDRLRFTVRDTGPGVPMEMRMRIFEEFVQAESGPVRHGGAGLGLAIVQKLVRRLGGEVGLDNPQGRGAAFWVELPARAVERAQVARPLAGVRVLIVSRGVLSDSLADLVSEAGGAVVWPAFDQLPAPVDVILLDHAVSQGHVSAYAAYDAPIIVLAPQEERAALATYEAAGVRHYLVKPLRRTSLIARVLTAIGKAEEESTPRVSAPPAPHVRPARGLRVLMAEDNAVNALLARTLLERSGCIVTVVGDGAEALAALSRETFDLAFLDLRMPVLDGMGAARRIRALPGPEARLPLIALTADAGEAERAAALAAGMDDFVTKPIHPSQLEDVLDRFTQHANEAKLAAS